MSLCNSCPESPKPNIGAHHLCGHVDVAVITITDEEHETVNNILSLQGRDGKSEHHVLCNGHSFTYGCLWDSGGHKLRVAVFKAGSQGNPAMAVLTTVIQMTLLPRLSILVGIAAGLKGKVKIGDVLIPERVVDFSFVVEKDVKSPGSQNGNAQKIRLPRHKSYDKKGVSNSGLTRGISGAAGEDAIESRKSFMRTKGINPDADHTESFPPPELIAAKDWGEFLFAHVGPIKKIPGVHDGILASSNALLKDESVLKELYDKHYDRVRGADMEAAGFAEACDQFHSSWMIVRGVSDFGDRFKSDSFHYYASASAAAYLSAFLKYNGNAKSIRNTRCAADVYVLTERTAFERNIYEILKVAADDFLGEKCPNIPINVGIYWKCTATFPTKEGIRHKNGAGRNEKLHVQRCHGGREPTKFHAFEPACGAEPARVAKYMSGSLLEDGEIIRLDDASALKWLSIATLCATQGGEIVGAICCSSTRPLHNDFGSWAKERIIKLKKELEPLIWGADELMYEIDLSPLDQEP